MPNLNAFTDDIIFRNFQAADVSAALIVPIYELAL